MITYVGAELRAEFQVTAIETVMMGRFCHHPMLSHKLSAEDLDQIRTAMEECRCWGFKDQELQTLSGGEKQLVALARAIAQGRSEEHTSELQSHLNLVCRLLLEKK